LETIT